MLRMRIVLTTLFLMVFLFSGTSLAADKQQLVKELILKSGLRKQLDQIPRNMHDGFDRHPNVKNMPKSKLKQLSRSIDIAFNVDTIEKVFLKRLNADLSLKEVKTIIDWLSSPLGIKITQLEEEAISPEAEQEKVMSLNKLLTDPAAPNRLKLLQRFETATQSTDVTTDLLLNLQIAIIYAASSAMAAHNPPSFDKVTEMVYKNRPQVKEMVSQNAISNFLYTYQDLSERELEQYIAFVESNIGLKYYEVVMNALSESMISASKKLGESIAELSVGDQSPSNI